MPSALSPSAAFAAPSPSGTPIPEEEEYYSSWSLFLVCGLLILSLWTSYYLQIKRIRAIHETLVAIFAGMFVGLVVRLAPGTMIRDMLVSAAWLVCLRAWCSDVREMLCMGVLYCGGANSCSQCSRGCSRMVRMVLRSGRPAPAPEAFICML